MLILVGIAVVITICLALGKTAHISSPLERYGDRLIEIAERYLDDLNKIKNSLKPLGQYYTPYVVYIEEPNTILSSDTETSIAFTKEEVGIK